jgi:hypothetical protein
LVGFGQYFTSRNARQFDCPFTDNPRRTRRNDEQSTFRIQGSGQATQKSPTTVGRQPTAVGRYLLIDIATAPATKHALRPQTARPRSLPRGPKRSSKSRIVPISWRRLLAAVCSALSALTTCGQLKHRDRQLLPKPRRVERNAVELTQRVASRPMRRAHRRLSAVPSVCQHCHVHSIGQPAPATSYHHLQYEASPSSANASSLLELR